MRHSVSGILFFDGFQQIDRTIHYMKISFFICYETIFNNSLSTASYTLHGFFPMFEKHFTITVFGGIRHLEMDCGRPQLKG